MFFFQVERDKCIQFPPSLYIHHFMSSTDLENSLKKHKGLQEELINFSFLNVMVQATWKLIHIEKKDLLYGLSSLKDNVIIVS